MRVLFFCFTLLFCGSSFAQTKVFTQDISNFFIAFDSVYKQASRAEQLTMVQTLYVDKASDGLKDFMALGGGNTSRWLNYMLYNKDYLTEMRPYLENVSDQIPRIQSNLSNMKEVYPAFNEGNIYFIIGCGMVGGSPNKQTNNLIIGAEVLVKKTTEWAIPAALHEFIHIQQKDGNGQLLTQTITEGVAEFLSEVFFEKDLAKNGFAPHLAFGVKNENAIWEKFKTDMFVINNGFLGWLYGSKNFSGQEIQDLGYFMGYKICKSYYDRSIDKASAIKTLLELDLSSNERMRAFLLESGYVSERDVNYVKSAVFTDKRVMKEINNPSVYGYRIEKEHIVFEYHIPSDFRNRYKGNISVVSIAGSFNDWNPDSQEYLMLKQANDVFKLTIPKSTIDLSTAQQFKFVINKDIWMPAPEMAKNVDAKSQNLTLQD